MIKEEKNTKDISVTPYNAAMVHSAKPVISNQEDTLYSIIGNIVEVTKLIKKVNSESPNRKPIIIINKRPNKEFLYYWVQVGIDNGIQFQPVYNFYVKKTNLEVSYYDAPNDSIMSLKKWREKRGW